MGSKFFQDWFINNVDTDAQQKARLNSTSSEFTLFQCILQIFIVRRIIENVHKKQLAISKLDVLNNILIHGLDPSDLSIFLSVIEHRESD